MRKRRIALIVIIAMIISMMPVCLSSAAGGAPGRVKITSVKASKASPEVGKGTVTVKWKKVKKASKYQVYLKRTDGKWKLAKTVKGSKKSAKIKAYVGSNMVKVRAVRKTSAGTVKGKFSKAKKFKVRSSRTLEKYMKSHPADLKDLKKDIVDEGGTVKIRDNDIIVSYDVENDVNDESQITPELKAELKKILKDNAEGAKKAIKDIEVGVKVGGARVIMRITYKGKKIVQAVFS